MFNAARFRNEDAARDHLEKLRWPNGSVCPHCGGTERNSKLHGGAHRAGLYFCGDCREQFTVTVGTVFERSKIPLHKWVLATHLLCSSKKGISSHQMHRILGVTYKTAWFMTHRIRHAMADPPTGKLGGPDKPVEADETYIGRKPGRKMSRGHAHKETVFSLVERGGNVRSIHITGKTFAGVKRALKAHVSPDATLMTDDARMYRKIAKAFADHKAVNHSAHEYKKGDACTNTVEGFFSVFKRGMTGVYQHCSSDHLHRYLAEFDFRYNNRAALGIDDSQRVDNALKSISGKRLTYGSSDHHEAA